MLACCLVCPGAAHAAVSDPPPDAQERAFCKLINAYRAQNGLPALRLSVALTKAARWLSTDMATKDYFDHIDSRDRAYSERIAAFGYKGTMKGENIAAGSNGSAATMLRTWKGSAEHKANMLRPRFRIIGIGRAFDLGSTFGWYWTTDFGATVDRTMPC